MAAVEARPVGMVLRSIPFSRSVISELIAAIDGVVVFLAGMIIYLLYVEKIARARLSMLPRVRLQH
jgi:hypothetical protein